MIARLKGVQLPDDPDFPSSTHPLAQYYPKPAPNQTGTKAQTPKPTSLLDNLKTNLVAKVTSGKDPINAIGAAVYKSIGDHLESSSPVQLASQIQTQGLTKTLQGIWSDIKTGLSNLNKPTLGASFAHNLSADDMNAVIDRRAELVNEGVDPHKATIQAASEIISKKVQDQFSNAVSGSTGGDEADVSKIVDKIANGFATGAMNDKDVASTLKKSLSWLDGAQLDSLTMDAKKITDSGGTATEQAQQIKDLLNDRIPKVGKASVPSPVKNFTGESNKEPHPRAISIHRCFRREGNWGSDRKERGRTSRYSRS